MWQIGQREQRGAKNGEGGAQSEVAPQVEVLSTFDGAPTAIRWHNITAFTWHPELNVAGRLTINNLDGHNAQSTPFNNSTKRFVALLTSK